MIKDFGVVREPRGLSWQEGSAHCKSTATRRPKYLVLVGIAVLAAIIGTLYLSMHSASSGYAKQIHSPHVQKRQLNLNDPNSTLNEVSPSAPQNATVSAEPSTETARLASPVRTLLACDYAAEAQAKLSYSRAVAEENTYHSAQLSLLTATSTVNSLFRPHATEDALQAESNRHLTTLSSLHDNYTSALFGAHCR